MVSKINQLTGLRYIAAISVFISHINWDGSSEILKEISKYGYIGVSFFFLLSGFVLSFSYSEKIIKKEINFNKYFLLRIARIYPLHILTTAIFVALYLVPLSFDVKSIFNLLLLQSWIPVPSYYFSVNASSWSISNEMFFYACFFPFILIRKESVCKILFGLIVLVFIIAIFFHLYLENFSIYEGENLEHWVFYINPIFRLIEFLSGIVIFFIWKSGYRLPKIFFYISFAFIIISMLLASYISAPYRYSLYFLPFVGLFFYSSLSEDFFVNSFLSNKLMLLLGNASFAFYLIHQPLIGILRSMTSHTDISNFVFFIFSLIVISFFSIVIYLAFEKPVDKKLRKIINNVF